MSVITPSMVFYITAGDPEVGDVQFEIVAPPSINALMSQPTDAEWINLGEQILASDYIQNQSWGSSAELVSITAPATRTVYPNP